MSNQTLRAVAIAKIKPEKREWIIENAFKELVEETRKEPGCLSYELCNEIKEPNTFVFIATWRSQKAFDDHFEFPHFIQNVRKIRENESAPLEIRLLQHFL